MSPGWPGSIPLLPSTRIPLLQSLQPAAAFHLCPAAASSCSTVYYCTSHPCCPCHSPWLHISWHSQPFASGVFMNPAASQHLPHCSSSSRLCYVRPPALACTCFLPHHRPRWWSPALRRLRPSSRGRSSHAGCTASRQWSESLCRETQERAGREMMTARERCQAPPGISRSLEVVTLEVTEHPNPAAAFCSSRSARKSSLSADGSPSVPAPLSPWVGER